MRDSMKWFEDKRLPKELRLLIAICGLAKTGIKINNYTVPIDTVGFVNAVVDRLENGDIDGGVRMYNNFNIKNRGET
jgi:hypothetical protein